MLTDTYRCLCFPVPLLFRFSRGAYRLQERSKRVQERRKTPEERSNPGLLNSSRKKRIARGSGNGVDEVNHFLRQFEKMRKMMHRMSKIQGKKGMKLPDLPGGFPNLMQ